ncbi:MAG: prepilin-type N-terminal cleavage/methylation domain-containing protein [Deltaproteobacteria bacterium]|nr:prepilin-type N-terminal cleavage/methylation domain-containing protein [Deltaproteobacteria bacterium]
MTTARPQSGMTLVEVMAAMAVFAVIATSLYSGLVQTMKNKQRTESELDRYHEIHMGLERMARELSMAYVSAHLNTDPSLQVVKTTFKGVEDGSSSRVDFTSFSHRRLYRNAHESDQNELSYFLTGHPEDRGREVLARREQRRVDDDPTEGGESQILIDDVKEFRLRFLDPETGEWLSTWDATYWGTTVGTEPNRLPSQVEIKITVPNVRGKGPDQTFGTRAMIAIRYALNHAHK